MLKSIAIIVVLSAAAVIGLWQLSKALSFQLFGEVVSRVQTQAPLVALTFDDGPSKQFAGEVLDILAKHNVRGTFFVTGHEAEMHIDQIRAIVAAGHEVGNHSYAHSRMIFMSPKKVRDELARTDAAIRAAGYKGPITFRPPYGVRLLVLPWILSQQNRLTVMWDVAPDKKPSAPASVITWKTLESAEPGSVILLHPMYSSRKTTRAALGDIINGLRARGLEPVTLSELLASKKRANF